MRTEPNLELSDLDWPEVLASAAAGDPEARDRVVGMTYIELHKRASCLLRKERPGITYQTTSLLNEALLQIMGRRVFRAKDQRHFLHIAARRMRRILIDRARGKNVAKRQGTQVAIDEERDSAEKRSPQLIALDDAMKVLSRMEPLAARVVELKYFGGYTDDETAEILDVNVARVRREWTYARAWLHDNLSNR